MAYGIISKPGTQYGPCEEPCAHIDCASLTQKAEDICHYCNEPIGYDTKFCTEDDRSNVHFWCAVKDAEAATFSDVKEGTALYRFLNEAAQ